MIDTKLKRSKTYSWIHEYDMGEKMVNKYRTKPCEIEAVQWNGNNEHEIFLFVGSFYHFTSRGELMIETLEGDMKASTGDYIIKGLRGEFYPCKPDVFEKKYELVK